MSNNHNEDPNASNRKADHINLAFKSKVSLHSIDQRFYYEPMLSGNEICNTDISIQFLGKKFDVPLWVSSMTGGTAMARKINHQLAQVCHDFGFGMGLGSCRGLLYSDEFLSDFAVRSLIGDQALFANLGIAQLEELANQCKLDKVVELLKKLEADGLIIHVNPLQEWLQPEGDRYSKPPVDTIARVRDLISNKIIVKEVGQGFGPRSMQALASLGVDAIDFAANGGTNFSKIELFRADEMVADNYGPIVQLGHNAEEMVSFVNEIDGDLEVIISGGINNFLDGYHLTSKCQKKAIYGMASGFLKYAIEDYDTLYRYTQIQVEGFKMAHQMLRVK